MGKLIELFLLLGRLYENAMAIYKNKKNQEASDAIDSDPVEWSNSHFNRVSKTDADEAADSKRDLGGKDS